MEMPMDLVSFKKHLQIYLNLTTLLPERCFVLSSEKRALQMVMPYIGHIRSIRCMNPTFLPQSRNEAA